MSTKHPIQPKPMPVDADSQRRLQLALEAQIAAAGAAGVLLFNGRDGSVTLVDTDVISALGYTPAQQEDGYLPISIVDLPLADPSEPLLRLKLDGGLVFIDGTGSADIAASSPSALRIRKSGVANGTVTFTGTSGVVSITNLVYSPGDLFELYPPATVDPTLDRVSITLRTV